MTEISTDDDDYGWHDNYDGDDDNIDQTKMTKKHKYYDFLVKIY